MSSKKLKNRNNKIDKLGKIVIDIFNFQSNTKKQSQILPATTEKVESRKQFMVPLDKRLQGVNVKQKPVSQI